MPEADVLPWAEAAIRKACELEEIHDPAGYIARLRDVLAPWAFGETKDSAQSELESVLTGWALLKLDDGDSDIPVMGGISLQSCPVPTTGGPSRVPGRRRSQE